jgi:hypothetical protein
MLLIRSLERLLALKFSRSWLVVPTSGQYCRVGTNVKIATSVAISTTHIMSSEKTARMEGQGKAVGCAPTALPLLCKRNYSKVQRRVVGLFYSRRGLLSQLQATHSQNSGCILAAFSFRPKSLMEIVAFMPQSAQNSIELSRLEAI